MGKKRTKRRQSHGCAWHWKQTDAWYATLPGAKKRVPLLDESGKRIRGKDNREAAIVALARMKVNWDTEGTEHGSVGSGDWIVARVCSEYLQYCDKGVAKGTLSKGHRDNSTSWLNDLCKYCGALPVSQLKKGHITSWIDSHATWKSNDTQRAAIAVVLAAFNRAQTFFDVRNPLKGIKKPRSNPRLTSISPDDEQIIYAACEERFRDFLFAAIHTGLRPFCELAKLTAECVEEHPRGMMWRVYSTKTKKTRRIPIRPEVAAVVRRLIKSAPAGSKIPIFRNTRGNPWKRTNGVVRFIAIRQKLQWQGDSVRSKYSCYACRHTFAHRMLAGYWSSGVGCSIETLAELMGDSPKVAFDHYGKEWGQQYQTPLWAAIGEAPTGDKQKLPRKATKSRATSAVAPLPGASKSKPSQKTRRAKP